MRRALALLALLLVAAATPAPAATPPTSTNDPVLGALVAELTRSAAKLRMPGYEPPYFVSYALTEHDDVDLLARHGALHGSSRTRNRRVYVEVRVGDYKFDNTADEQLSGEDAGADAVYEPGSDMAIDDDAGALRGQLWLITDARYKQALAALNLKRGQRATTVVEDADLPSFARARPVTHTDAIARVSVDSERWASELRAASGAFTRHPQVFDDAVSLSVQHERRWLVNSEGTRLYTERTIWGLTVECHVRTDDGAVIEHTQAWYGAGAAELPSGQVLLGHIERLAGEAEALRVAPVIDPYTGPAILLEDATGVLFHEVIGHRLEGERLADDEEGHTFKGQQGTRVIPAFLDVLDDPTRRVQGAHALNGHYDYDDEGVPSEPVTLIDRGVLRSFLTSRRPLSGATRSNGHGRAEGAYDPMARMGVTVVRSHQAVPMKKLEAMLLAEARKQGKPYGLVIVDVTGGDTNTGADGYQAFRGSPQLVYKVDAKSGARTLVRGVEMVGTPLSSINKIVATSDTVGVFNGYCGAESGFVPVSVLAPAVLMTEIELQRSQKTRQKPLLLPPPWATPAPAPKGGK
jgi:predicted Zn-dependent protease